VTPSDCIVKDVPDQTTLSIFYTKLEETGSSNILYAPMQSCARNWCVEFFWQRVYKIYGLLRWRN